MARPSGVVALDRPPAPDVPLVPDGPDAAEAPTPPRDAGCDRCGDSQLPADAALADLPALDGAYPRGPYGTALGATLAPFQLTDCSSRPWRFDEPGFFRSRVSVLELTTGWCSGCAAASQRVEAELHRAYQDRGVRVLEVLLEGAAVTEPPTSAFCNERVRALGLTFPVLADVTGMLRPLAPSGVLPTLVVVDDRGVIRWRSASASTAVEGARAQLDALLR